MKKAVPLIFLTCLTLSTVQSRGQIDTTAIDAFLEKQLVGEQNFMILLKAGNIDSCIKYFSPAVIKKYGVDSLKKEIGHLSYLLSKYPDPKGNFSLGKSHQGIGTFGHDNDGNFETQSIYQFLNKDSVVYYFTLYYSDKDPITVIKFFDSPNLTDNIFLKVKPNKPAYPLKKSQNNP